MDIRTSVKLCIKIPMYYNVKPILGFAGCYTKVGARYIGRSDSFSRTAIRGEISHHHLTIVDLSVGVAWPSQGMVG